MKISLSFLFVVLSTTLISINARAQEADPSYGDYERAYQYLFDGKTDSAFRMFNYYINNADDSLKKGKAYLFMGEMLWNVGDLYGAQESLMGSVRTLKESDALHREFLGYTYNVLGNVSLNLKLYDEAIRLYNTAITFSTVEYLPELMNGKATAFQKKGSYSEAIAIYDSILAWQPADKMLLARMIDNRAFTKWLADPGYAALPELHAALKLRADSQFMQGLNASYAHLSDYYARSNIDSSLWYAHKMLEIAREIRSPDDVLEAMDKLVLLSKSADVKEQWYASFKNLKDSLQFSRDNTRTRFALIRYDIQKSKADNLALQQHVNKQQVIMYVLIALVLIVIGGLYWWYYNRKKRIRQEAEKAIQESKLKTSQKVHDVVANELYGIMNELEHGKEIEREPLLSRIEELYEKSRDISYEEVGSVDDTDYDKQIHGLLNEFTNEQTNVFAVGNQPAFWGKVTGFQKKQLLLILREIMTNMKKHSCAHNVVIRFKEENKTGTINYSDDGKGFPSNIEYGNGLNNTVNRIKSLNGEIIFGKSDKGGASIVISFPLQSSKA